MTPKTKRTVTIPNRPSARCARLPMNYFWSSLDDRKGVRLIFQRKTNFYRDLPMINFAVFNVTARFRHL